MKIQSLDPRVSRMALDKDEAMPDAALESNSLWETYEVFHQKKKGTQHSHVGIVHAPDEVLALIFAKEQFGRRGETVNLWVVKSQNVFASDYKDYDIFETVPLKNYREASGYKVGDKIKAYKNRKKSSINPTK